MTVIDYLKRIYSGSAAEFTARAAEGMLAGKKQFVVTANPEILMRASKGDEEASRLLCLPETLVAPDGISVVKAMRRCGLPVQERVTGVDLAQGLLEAAGQNGRTVCLLGAREEVVATLAAKYRERYPAMTLRFHNGYDGDKDDLMAGFAAMKPDLVLVALGVPAQEKLIARHLDAFEKGTFVGVGGSFDVLSGLKRRAPEFFIRTNTEWLYRIVREPARFKRFYESNIKFLFAVRRAARESKKKS